MGQRKVKKSLHDKTELVAYCPKPRLLLSSVLPEYVKASGDLDKRPSCKAELEQPTYKQNVIWNLSMCVSLRSWQLFCTSREANAAS